MTDAREAFIAGASWWAAKEGQPDQGNLASESERYFPEGRMDHPNGVYGRRKPEGTWPATYVGRAFVEGARWQQYAATNFTMWQSDRDEVEAEARRRYPALCAGDDVVLSNFCKRFYFRGPRFPDRVGTLLRISEKENPAGYIVAVVRWPNRKHPERLRLEFLAQAPQEGSDAR